MLPIPAAALARCRVLLDGIAILLENGRGAVVGALLRPLYEMWLVGFYSLLGGLEAAETLLDARDYRLRLLDADFLHLPARVGTGKQLPIKKLAGEVQRLLKCEATTKVLFDPLILYKTLYPFDSYSTVHGGIGALDMHMRVDLVLEDAADPLPIVVEPDDGGLACQRLTLAALLTIELAEELWASGDLDLDELISLEANLRRANRETYGRRQPERPSRDPAEERVE